MKRIILSTLLALMSTFAFAQKGQIWLGGSAGYNHKSTSIMSSNTLDMNIYPEFYITDTWSVYGGPLFNYEAQNINLDIYSIDTKSTSGGLFIGTTKYFPLSEKFALYARFEVDGAWGSGKEGSQEYSLSHYDVMLTPGLNFLLHDKIALFLELGKGLMFESINHKDKDSGQSSNETNFSAEFLTSGISVGVLFRLK